MPGRCTPMSARHLRPSGTGWELARSAVTRGAAEKVLLLTGRAGVGKTHLLCDAARRRIEDGLPTILLLGQDFDGRSLLAQAGELSQLGATPDDVLAVLDAASEAAGCTGLLMIDALNESERPDRWPGDVRALVAACRRYPHVALFLSCRTEFVEEVIGDEKLPRVEHFGFAEATDAAIMRFTQEYGLEPPTFPALNPEFSNPLYLKLTCEALHTLGETRFRFGTAGLTTVTSAFIEAVNQRLSEAGRCNYDKWSDLAGACVRQLAELGRGPWDRADVQRITEGLLPGREWSTSLLKGLIAEGILIELRRRPDRVRLPAAGRHRARLGDRREGPGRHTGMAEGTRRQRLGAARGAQRPGGDSPGKARDGDHRPGRRPGRRRLGHRH